MRKAAGRAEAHRGGDRRSDAAKDTESPAAHVHDSMPCVPQHRGARSTHMPALHGGATARRFSSLLGKTAHSPAPGAGERVASRARLHAGGETDKSVWHLRVACQALGIQGTLDLAEHRVADRVSVELQGGEI